MGWARLYKDIIRENQCSWEDADGTEAHEEVCASVALAIQKFHASEGIVEDEPADLETASYFSIEICLLYG